MTFILWLIETLTSSCVAVRQEQELRNGGAIDKKLTTLADLFRPPIDLMHKGSFETVSCWKSKPELWILLHFQWHFFFLRAKNSFQHIRDWHLSKYDYLEGLTDLYFYQKYMRLNNKIILLCLVILLKNLPFW